MARAVKGAGKGSALKRKDRRQAKYTPGPGPDSFKPVGVADKAVAVGEKEKKAPGKLSKKRKAEGGGSGAAAAANGDDKKHKFAKKTSGGSTGGGKDGKYAGSGGKDASWAKKAPLSNKHADAPKHVATTRKEQKAANDEKKAYQKPNFTLVTEIVTMWERLRVKKISAVDKRALVVSIFKACVGKVPDLANNHKGSRVIQALLKYGTKEEVAAIYGECTPQIAMLAKSLYGHFIVKKLVDGTSKDKLPALLAHVQGSVRTLAKHPVGSQVLESLYFPAPPAQKKSMEVEFYGAEYALFGAAGDGTGATAVKSLKEAMLRKPVAQRQGMLRQMNAALLPILEKGLVSPSIIHKVLAEYLDVGGPGTKFEAAHSLAGPAFLRMVHTREGAHAVNLMLTHAGAKQRKAVLKALKGQVGRIVRDEHASVAVMCMLDSVDDTQLLAKVIVAELRQEGLAELAEDRAARRVLLHLLRPRSTRYVHPHVLATLPDPAAVAAAVESSKLALTAGGHQVGEVGDEAEEADAADGDDADMEDGVEDDEEMDEEMMDDEFDDEEEEADRKPTSQMTKQKSNAALAGGDDDDDDEAGGGGGDSVDFGISRKPQEARRREIFSAPGHLGRSLVASCIGAAGGMLRSAVASDVLLEVCSGGAGGVVTASVGADQLGELHAAVAEAVRASVAGEERVEEEEEEGKGKGKEPLHTDYFSTRTLRRMVLEIPGGGDATAAGGDGPVAPCFAAALWEGAVAHDPAAWVGGHGAKVLAAIIRAGDAATKQEAAAAVQKIVKDKTPQEWAAGFFRHEDAKQGDGAGVKGAKKAKQGGSAGGAKGPGAAKGASTAKADKGVKGATPAKADRATTPAKTPKGDKAPKASTPQVTAEVEEKSATKTAGKKARAAAAAAAEVEAGEKTPVVVKSGLSVKTAKTTAGKGSKGEGGKSPKSPKELKFSPRLTRAQRVEKAAKEAAK